MARPPTSSRSASGLEIRIVQVLERMRWVPIAVWSLLAVAWVLGAETAETMASPVSVRARQVHAIFRMTPRLYSGAQPEGDAAFAELAQMGIQTLVSVDGARPDVAAARRHGLRYVHLPIGYDGISTQRGVQLVKAISGLPSPLYVHCHHGQHRGPAAAAVMAMAREGWTSDRAVAWMHQAGTSTNYPGLYGAVRQFRCPDPGVIDGVGELPETAAVTGRVAAMVDLDARWNRLEAWQRRSWKPMPGEEGPSLHQEALQFWEALHELGRREVTEPLSLDYRRRHTVAEERARAFLDQTAKPEPGSVKLLDGLARGIAESCTGCHREHRD
ncbi:MAG: hypothetical protein RLZ45_2528 [Verrucomicrobiota bacterium]